MPSEDVGAQRSILRLAEGMSWAATGEAAGAATSTSSTAGTSAGSAHINNFIAEVGENVKLTFGAVLSNRVCA